MLDKVTKASPLSLLDNFSDNQFNYFLVQLWFVSVMQVLTGLNIYDILEPCFHNPYKEEDSKGNKSLPSGFRELGKTERPLPVRKRMFGRAWPFRAPVRDGTVPLWPELISNAEVECTVSLA